MTPDKYERLKGLFERALETSPKHRAVMIDKVRQADEELGRELEALVEAYTDSGGADAPGSDAPDPDRTDSMDLPVVEFAREKPAFSNNEVLLERFRIVRFIDRGGMGEVYEAEDLQLGRVALKTIRADLAAHPRMMERFRQEVQMARRVTSRNVCRIHDLFPFPAGDRRSTAAFLTMEFLEGTTLAKRIESQGELPLPEARQTALQLCTALQAIHDAGVIHRDIKSRNIMLVPRNGTTQAVVMDLGLARESVTKADGGDTGLTVRGSVVGTPNYMAPEQFEGKQATPATDIYALGVVLYEMVTGKLPFEGSTPLQAAVRRAKRPPSASSVRAKLPKQWDVVIGRCLEFEPENRYQSASEVGEALQGRQPVRWRRMGAVAAAVVLSLGIAGAAIWYRTHSSALPNGERRQLVVLPFENVGGDPGNQAFCDGLLEILTSATSETSALQQSFQVIPASEVRHDNLRSIQDARKVLNINLALTGSVIRSGNSLAVTITLSDAGAMRQLTSRVIRSSGDDVVGMQASLLSAVFELLQLQMQPQAKSVVNASTHNSTAFDLYLKGEGYLRRSDGPASVEAAIPLLEKAVQLDPSFTLARAALAEAYFGRYDVTKDPQWLARADEESSSAGELNDRIPQVHATAGLILRGTGRYEEAAAEFRKAIALDPADFESQRLLARTLENLGRPTEAEGVYLNAIRSKPSYWPTDRSLGVFYLRRGEYGKAEPWMKLVTELAPQNATGFLNLGILYDLTGRHAEAEAALRKSIALQPLATTYANLGTIQFFQLRFQDAMVSSEKAVQLGPNDPYNWGNLADAYRQVPSRRQDSDPAYRKAIDLAGQQLAVNPNNAALRGSLAVYLAKTGERKESLTEISRALSVDSRDFNIAVSAAQVYEISGDHAQAIRYLKDALARGYPVDEARVLPDFAGLRANPELQHMLSEHSPKN